MGGEGGQIARNEAIFRNVNEDIEGLAGVAEVSRFEIVCECGSRGCVEMISVTRQAYEAVRAAPERFFVKHGHELLQAETVVEKYSEYVVVEKRPGEPARVARAMDPRS